MREVLCVTRMTVYVLFTIELCKNCLAIFRFRDERVWETIMTKNLLSRPDLAESREAFRLACQFSRAWNAILNAALQVHGDHGPFVSGAGREHFPDDLKTELRRLARTVSEQCDAAYKARPTRVRLSTIVLLGRAVAHRDGCGYYGPSSQRS